MADLIFTQVSLSRRSKSLPGHRLGSTWGVLCILSENRARPCASAQRSWSQREKPICREKSRRAERKSSWEATPWPQGFVRPGPPGLSTARHRFCFFSTFMEIQWTQQTEHVYIVQFDEFRLMYTCMKATSHTGEWTYHFLHRLPWALYNAFLQSYLHSLLPATTDLLSVTIDCFVFSEILYINGIL